MKKIIKKLILLNTDRFYTVCHIYFFQIAII